MYIHNIYLFKGDFEMLLKILFDDLQLIERHSRLEDYINDNSADEIDSFYIMLKIIMDKKDKEYIYKLNNEEEKIETDEELLAINKIIASKPIVSKINEIISVNEELSTEENIRYIVTNPPIYKFIASQYESKEIFKEGDLIQLYKNTIFNLCNLIENFTGKILKNHLIDGDTSEELGEMHLTYNEIMRFRSVDEAKSYLIDKLMLDFFRPKFLDWISTFEKKVKIGITNNKELKIYINTIQEMFYIRNLYTHAGGIVNEEFILKSKRFKGIEKGTQFVLTKELLKEFEQATLNFLIGIIYYYEKKKINQRKPEKEEYDDFMTDINNLIIHEVTKEYIMIKKIFQEIAEDKVNLSLKLYAKVNSYIYDYLHLEEEEWLEDMIRNFDVSSLQDEFKLAKSILSKDTDNARFYLNRILEEDETMVFNIYDWPLIKIAREHDPGIANLIEQKVSDILSIRESDLNGEEN